MGKSEVSRSSVVTSVAIAAVVVGFVAVSLFGPPRSKAQQGSYMMPPVINPVTNPVHVTPPFNNPVSNPLDVTRLIPGAYNQNSPTLNMLGAQVGGPATLGVGTPKAFPGADNLKGNPDFILVQPETGADTHRESPYLVTLTQGTVLAGVHRPSNMGMIHTPLGEVAFSANSDSFVSFNNGTLRIRNVDGTGQTVRVRITSGPLAGKVYSVQPGYELVVSDHKLSRTDLRPTDGILRRASQSFDNGFAGVSQYHVHSALQQSGVVSQLNANKNGSELNRKVIGDMSRMAAVLNSVQGGAGYAP